jgi:chromate transporter
MDGAMTDPSARRSLTEITPYFPRLGALGFGGSVALCGQMKGDLVRDRRWLRPSWAPVK